MTRALRVSVVRVWLLGGLVAGGAAAARAADCQAMRYAGRPLVEALEHLRTCGLSIIYSSDRVRPHMRVEAEPAGASPRLILDELLAAHGLAAIDGPRGRVLIVAGEGAGEPRRVGPEAPLPLSLVEKLTVTPGRRAEQDEPEPRLRVLDDALRETPNIGSDVPRAVSRLPGIASADRSAQLSVRGGAPDEVLFVLDGLEIVDPFHLKAFQSFSGIVDARAVGSADVMTGGFPVRYGDRMGGVIDMSSSSLAGGGRTIMGAGSINTHLLSGGELDGGAGEWLVSARAWYPDTVGKVIAPTGEDIGPTYLDLFGKARARLGDATSLSGNLLMSRDTADYSEQEGGRDEQVTARSRSEYAWLNLDSAWTPRLFSHTHLSAGRIRGERRGSSADETAPAIRVEDERSFDVFGVRQEWGYHAAEAVFLRFGLEARQARGTYDYSAQIAGHTGAEEPVASSTPEHRAVLLEPSGHEVGAYLSGRFKLRGGLTLELGARWDRQSHTSEDQLSPRLSAVYALGARSALRFGWGRFYQSQGIHELQVEDGVGEFHPAQRSEHRIVGFEHDFARGPRLRLSAYSKQTANPRPRFENLFDPLELFPEAEADRVRIAPTRAQARGVELLLESAPGRKLGWWTSYALASTEDEIDGQMVPRSWDQRHALNLGLSYRPSPGWTFGLAGIYHSGWPTTAMGARTVLSADGSLVVEPAPGPRNAERFPAYHRLDIKVSRHVSLQRGRLTFFLEVLNLYDQENPCCVDSFRFTPRPGEGVDVGRREAYWLDRLPSLGVVWELRGR